MVLRATDADLREIVREEPLEAGARLEWLPLETILYSGCLAENQQQFTLADDAEMIGWDLLALGLPAAGQAFERGALRQTLAIPGRWLEQGRVAADEIGRAHV